MAMTVFQRGWFQFLNGKGPVPLPDAGNTCNAPGDAPVQTGNYQFIQSFAFQGQGHVATDIQPIPPLFRDWGQYAVNSYDASGLGGGGINSGTTVGLPVETDLWFDPTTNLYYNLGNTSEV